MKKGMTLLEIIVAVGLLAMVIIFVITLLPSSVLSLQRAEDVQAAAAYGQEVLDMARSSPPAVDTATQFPFTINRSTFTITRQTHAVPGSPGLEDVVVLVQGPRGSPARLGTRVITDAP